MSGSSQGRLQGGLNQVPRDKQSLSGILAEGQIRDSISSDSVVKMNETGLWG